MNMVGNTPEVALSSTLKASKNSLICPLGSLVVVGSSRLAFTVSGRMANPLTICALGSTLTIMGIALTWWNSYVKTVNHDVAYAMTWKTLKKVMTDKYYPRGEIKKLEVEMWNMKVKGTDVVGYNQHFQELALMCDRMFLEESDMIKKYVGGLPDMIHESMMATKPKIMQDAMEFATELMDKKSVLWLNVRLKTT
nr:reverse transcriptase domain-containing protein [Tanacetum cinerariifolium]